MALPAEVRTQVEIAAASGMTVREIVEGFGITKTTVHRWLNPRRAESSRESCRRWREAHPQEARDARLRWCRENPEKARDLATQYGRNWRAKNPEKARIKNKKNHQQQYAKFPERIAEKAMKRRARTWKVPLTQDEKKQIQALIKEARCLTAETGIPHEVDHIWPVSRGGWHHPANMRVITQEENRKKRDRLPTLEEMLRNTKAEEIP